jgi:hypothetical protein
MLVKYFGDGAYKTRSFDNYQRDFKAVGEPVGGHGDSVGGAPWAFYYNVLATKD